MWLQLLTCIGFHAHVLLVACCVCALGGRQPCLACSRTLAASDKCSGRDACVADGESTLHLQPAVVSTAVGFCPAGVLTVATLASMWSTVCTKDTRLTPDTHGQCQVSLGKPTEVATIVACAVQHGMLNDGGITPARAEAAENLAHVVPMLLVCMVAAVPHYFIMTGCHH